MSSLTEIEAAADTLSTEQKHELLRYLSSRLRVADEAPKQLSEINKTPGVCGENACVRNTRIPVWTLVQIKKLGRNEEQLLRDFPSLISADLDAVWQYYRQHPTEIDETIAAEEGED